MAEVAAPLALFAVAAVVLVGTWATARWGAGPVAALRRDVLADPGFEFVQRFLALGAPALGLVLLGLVAAFLGFTSVSVDGRPVVAAVVVMLIAVGAIGLMWSVLWFLPLPAASLRPSARAEASVLEHPADGVTILRGVRPWWSAVTAGVLAGVALGAAVIRAGWLVPVGAVLALLVLVPSLPALVRGTWVRLDDEGAETMTGLAPVRVPWAQVGHVRAGLGAAEVELHDPHALTERWTPWQRLSHPVRGGRIRIPVSTLRITPAGLAGLIEDGAAARGVRPGGGDSSW